MVRKRTPNVEVFPCVSLFNILILNLLLDVFFLRLPACYGTIVLDACTAQQYITNDFLRDTSYILLNIETYHTNPALRTISKHIANDTQHKFY